MKNVFFAMQSRPNIILLQEKLRILNYIWIWQKNPVLFLLVLELELLLGRRGEIPTIGNRLANNIKTICVYNLHGNKLPLDLFVSARSNTEYPRLFFVLHVIFHDRWLHIRSHIKCPYTIYRNIQMYASVSCFRARL